MARTRTLTNLIADVRLRADCQALADADITEFINQSLADLTDTIIINDAASYYEKSVNFNTVANVASVSLASIAPDFYKVVGVWWSATSGLVPMRRYTQIESETVVPSYGWFYNGTVGYNVEGDALRFQPTPLAVSPCVLKYVPWAARLVAGGDTFDGINGWEEWVICDAALKCLEREGADPTELGPLTARRDRQEARITALIERDQAEPMRIQDTRTMTAGWWGRY